MNFSNNVVRARGNLGGSLAGYQPQGPVVVNGSPGGQPPVSIGIGTGVIAQPILVQSGGPGVSGPIAFGPSPTSQNGAGQSFFTQQRNRFLNSFTAGLFA